MKEGLENDNMLSSDIGMFCNSDLFDVSTIAPTVVHKPAQKALELPLQSQNVSASIPLKGGNKQTAK